MYASTEVNNDDYNIDIDIDDPYYKNMGYILLFTLSGIYFICSAYILRYVTSAK